ARAGRRPRGAPMSALLARMLPVVAASAVSALGATLSVRAAGVDALRPLWQARRPLIYAVWHGRILIVPWLNARLRRSEGARRARRLGSWDRFMVPAPFARCAVVFGGLLEVKGHDDREDARLRVERALEDATDAADALVGARR